MSHASAPELRQDLTPIRDRATDPGGVFAKNLEALRDRDPALAARVEAIADGVAVAQRVGEGQNECLIPALVEGGKRPGECGALIGVGDGGVIELLAQEGPIPHTHGVERPVFVIEPELANFVAALKLRDLSGAISAERFSFFVGEGFRGELLDWAGGAIPFPPPTRAVRGGAPSPMAEQALAEAHRVVAERVATLEREVAALYAGRTFAESAQRLRSGDARIMFVTTRFSTVLKYSTADFEAGAQGLGMETVLHIERAPHHHHTRTGLLDCIVRFKPDLIFEIDHHRHEIPRVFPQQLPFVCVIQDNLANLTAPGVGDKLGVTDFVTGPWVHRYIREFGYPEDRCIESPRPTRSIALPAVMERAERGSILYVSNHSSTPERAIESMLEMIGAHQPAREIAQRTAEDLLAMYREGRAVDNHTDVEALAWANAQGIGTSSKAVALIRQISELIAVKLNNALYRQQGLLWAVQAAEELGLRLDLYGGCWEEHPVFKDHARGVIAYGDDLIRATREATCSLMLEPFFATSHQRSLDVWMAGGCLLIRERDRDRVQQEFMAWLDRVPDGVYSYEEAVKSFSGGDRGRFEAVCKRHRGFDPQSEAYDLVGLNLKRRAAGVGFLMQTPPSYDACSFRDAQGLVDCIKNVALNGDRRSEVISTMHGWVNDHFSYESSMKLIVSRIAESLEALG